MKRSGGKQKQRAAHVGKAGQASSPAERDAVVRAYRAGRYTYRAGRYKEAIAGARTYTSRFPRDADGWILRAAAASKSGAPQEAIRAYRRAWKIEPDNAEIGNSLGALLIETGELTAAVDVYRAALQANPDSLPLNNNLGFVLNQLQRFEEAEQVLRHALSIDPGYAAGHNNLGNALEGMGRIREAEASFRDALRITPHFPEALKNLGNMLRLQERVEEACSAYQQAVRQNPQYAPGWLSLGAIHGELGHRKEAEEAYRRAVRLRPDYVAAWSNLAVLKRFTAGDEDLQRVEALLQSPGQSVRDRAILHFVAGKAYADIGEDVDRVFRHYAQGAQLERSRIDYDVRQDEVLFQRIREAFPEVKPTHPAPTDESRSIPVFIVGMPRSGTTLVEQILASHSAVKAVGERLDLDTIVAEADARFGSTFPDWMAHADRSTLDALGDCYRARVTEPVEDATRVVDKMPNNFRFLGLIARILPEARVVHVQRDPLDTCWSCFSHRFRGEQPFSYDLAELGRYYRAYHGLMSHWRRVLPPAFMLELGYEELIENPEEKVRELLDHCRLDWEAACLEFHRTERSVRTASVMQVRQPLYKRAIGRWKPYRAHLGPLIEQLGPLANDV